MGNYLNRRESEGGRSAYPISCKTCFPESTAFVGVGVSQG